MNKYFDHFIGGKPTQIGDFLHHKKIVNEFKLINKFVQNSNIEILEIGPGKGDLAITFLKNGYVKYDIVEPNDIMRSELVKVGVRSAKNYMVPELREKDGSYDLIIASDVFEHLNSAKEAHLFISEAKRVLRKNGLLFILSPDYLDWKEDFFNCDFSHSNPTSIRRTMQLFYNSNITTVYWDYSYACFKGATGKLLNMAIKTITHFSKGNSLDSKPYKLRLTFLGRIRIIGKNEESK
jgi:SAM-dependent methyltransferase